MMPSTSKTRIKLALAEILPIYMAARAWEQTYKAYAETIRR